MGNRYARGTPSSNDLRPVGSAPINPGQDSFALLGHHRFSWSFRTLRALVGWRLLVGALSMACTCRSTAEDDSKVTGRGATALPATAATSGTPQGKPSPPQPPTTPPSPPQLVACDGKRFYRITRGAFQGFTIASEIPPPHIRGSRVARQTTQTDVEEPLNVVLLGGGDVVTVAKKRLLRYSPSQNTVERHASIPLDPPVSVWPDPRSSDAFWVRSHVAKTSKQVRLGGARRRAPPSVEGTGGTPSAVELPVTAGAVIELAPFDGRLFAALADGTPVYSGGGGLWVGHGDSRRSLEVNVPDSATSLFADEQPTRVWSASPSGQLQLWDLGDAKSPVHTLHVPGEVLDIAIMGDNVAVLSMELDGQFYQPHASIFAGGELQKQVRVAPTVATQGQPALDVCLLPDRPWLVVGGVEWLQLLDWSTSRLLAEW